MTGNGSKQLRRYNVRGPDGEWLAMVVISDDGFFSTVSDYGTYAYFWSDAEGCFREFLSRLGSDYYLSKFGVREEYDGAETLKFVKRSIIEQRSDGGLSRDGAREEWNLLGENDGLDQRDNFVLWCQATQLGDAHEYACSSMPGDACRFAQYVWPAFVAMLRTELAAEAKAA